MKTLKKIIDFKDRFKTITKKQIGKLGVSFGLIGLLIPLLPFWEINIKDNSSIGILMISAVLMILSAPVLMFLFFDEKNLNANDSKTRRKLFINILKLITISISGIFINKYLNWEYAFLGYLNALGVILSITSLQMFFDKGYPKQIAGVLGIGNNQKETIIEKLPLILNLKEEEQELGLTNYFNK